MTWSISGNPVSPGTVAGFCPYGCGETLHTADGGHIVCNGQDCPNPTAVDKLLHMPHEHIVIFTEQGFTIEHTLSERIEQSMAECPLMEALHTLGEMPVSAPGRYLAVKHQPDGYSESYRSDSIGWDFIPTE